MQKLVDGILVEMTVEEVQAFTAQQEIDSQYRTPEYLAKRIEAYPSITDQFDMMYHDKINGTTVWSDTITKIKTDIPKPDIK